MISRIVARKEAKRQMAESTRANQSGQDAEMDDVNDEASGIGAGFDNSGSAPTILNDYGGGAGSGKETAVSGADADDADDDKESGSISSAHG